MSWTGTFSSRRTHVRYGDDDLARRNAPDSFRFGTTATDDPIKMAWLFLGVFGLYLSVTCIVLHPRNVEYKTITTCCNNG